MEKNNCKECGAALYGRTDKKFCDDMCRNAHNNKLNSDTTNYVRNINNILRRNRRIIQQLRPGRTVKIPRKSLIYSGFNFSYHTHKATKSGKSYFFCYEYGYSIQKSECLLIKINHTSTVQLP